LVLFLGWWLIGWLGAYASTQPNPSNIRERRTIAGHTVEDLDIVTSDELTVRSWLLDVPAERRRCVILAAGIRGNRQGMVSRAAFYAELGWSSLLVDLRGTGSSDRARISMGWHEALDLIACHDVLRKRGYEVVGVHGQSLGAAAAAYTSVRTDNPPAWDFVVLEACYSDIAAALQSRAFGLPMIALLPFFTCAEWLLDVNAADLNAVAALRQQNAPLLVACGTLDYKVGPEATARLLAASPAKDKVRCDVPGVGHRDLWRHGGSEVQAALREFLQRR
jgi:pimeloyl-ACP methyl ester carboxylesterase